MLIFNVFCSKTFTTLSLIKNLLSNEPRTGKQVSLTPLQSFKCALVCCVHVFRSTAPLHLVLYILSLTQISEKSPLEWIHEYQHWWLLAISLSFEISAICLPTFPPNYSLVAWRTIPVYLTLRNVIKSCNGKLEFDINAYVDHGGPICFFCMMITKYEFVESTHRC